MDPLVTVMKVDKAPPETYADIGGLDQQIQVGYSLNVITSIMLVTWTLKLECFSWCNA